MPSHHRFRITSAQLMVGLAAMFLPMAAHADPDLDLLHLQVFAKQSIDGARSDYQGPTAAGGGIKLSDFEIGGDLTSGDRVSFVRGRVRGLVSSPVRSLTQVFSSGSGTFNPMAFDLASARLDLLGSRLSRLPATAVAQVVAGREGEKRNTRLVINATHDLDVVDLTADQLMSNVANHRDMFLNGDRRSHLIVRVSGRSVTLRDLGFVVAGNLSPSQVAFYFPDATDLEVTSSGGAMSPDGRSWGIPGSVVAPDAVLRFTAALITGQVFVKAIASPGDFVSGQIDRMPSATPGGRDVVAATGFAPSEVLSLIDRDAFAASSPVEARRIIPMSAIDKPRARECSWCLPHTLSMCD